MSGLTEEQAKAKACFKAATFGGSQQLAEGPGPNCIATKCMAWRDLELLFGEIVERKDALPGSTRPVGIGWGYQPAKEVGPGKTAQWVRREPGEPRGYCGLAGRPEE